MFQVGVREHLIGPVKSQRPAGYRVAELPAPNLVEGFAGVSFYPCPDQFEGNAFSRRYPWLLLELLPRLWLRLGLGCSLLAVVEAEPLAGPSTGSSRWISFWNRTSRR